MHNTIIKVMSVFGTRPEAIKMAPIVKALESDTRFDSSVLVTAQHREMLDQVLSAFDISPDYDLNLMKHGQTLSEITSRVLEAVTSVLRKDRPDVLLVHGDTTTTFAAALAATYLDIPVGHIEAGMRTGDKRQPFPEEVNRMLVAQLAYWHFAPSDLNASLLEAEGIDSSSIIRTPHNTVIDALLLAKQIAQKCDNQTSLLASDETTHIVATVHRRENWGKPMREIFESFLELASRDKTRYVSVVTHANPEIQSLACEVMGNCEQIEIRQPLAYLDFVKLLSSANLIVTDSGGIQEEGPTLGIPVVVLRNKTEYSELLDAGLISIAGTAKSNIVPTIESVLSNSGMYKRCREFASQRLQEDSTSLILAAIAERFKG